MRIPLIQGRITIGLKLAAAMATCLVSTLLVGYSLTVEISRMTSFTEALFEREYRVAAALREVETDLVTINRDMLVVLIDRSANTHEALMVAAISSEERIAQSLDRVAEIMPDYAQDVDNLRAAVDEWRPLWLGVFQLAGKGGHDFAYDAYRAHGPAQLTAIRDALAALRARADAATSDFVLTAAETKERADYKAMMIIAAAFVLTLGCGMALARSIVRSIVDLNGSVSALSTAEREFEVPHTRRGDEIGDIARGIDDVRRKLSEHQRERARREAEKSREEDGRNRTLNELHRMCEALADGELTARMAEDLPSQYRSVANQMNQSFNRLGGLVNAVHNVTDALGATATDLQTQAVNLSSQSERQSGLVEDTAQTMEAMTAAITTNAEMSKEATTSTQYARGCADEGVDVVAKAVAAMSQISETSGKISEIASTIEGIAFQTNLLALNASVESARAGEAGKGFAVVASEVRSLSVMTTEAASAINALTKESAQNVNNGVSSIGSVGEKLSETKEAIISVVNQVETITAATQEQFEGISRLNSTFREVNEGTADAASNAVRTKAASTSLESEIANLENLMAAFRTDASPQRNAA